MEAVRPLRDVATLYKNLNKLTTSSERVIFNVFLLKAFYRMNDATDGANVSTVQNIAGCHTDRHNISLMVATCKVAMNKPGTRLCDRMH